MKHPDLIHAEVLNALRRGVRRESLSVARAEEALQVLSDLPITDHSAAPLSVRVWNLREELSAYDATYVAVAEALDATLIAADGQLARQAARLVETLDLSPAATSR